MIQNLNDNSTNRSISVEGRPNETFYLHVIPDSEFFGDLAQMETWIDRNQNSMTQAEFVKQLLLRIRNCRKNGYELQK